MRSTVGTSASVMNQLSFDATVFALVHAAERSSENFNVAVVSLRSSQLRITPRAELVSCGCPASPCAATSSGWIAISNGCSGAAFGGGSARRHETANAATHSNTATNDRFMPPILGDLCAL